MRLHKRWHILVATVVLAACRILHDSLIPIAPASTVEVIGPTTAPVEEHAADEIGWRTDWLQWLLTLDKKPLDAPARFASSESGPSNDDGGANAWLLGDQFIGAMTITGSQTAITTPANRGPVVTVLN